MKTQCNECKALLALALLSLLLTGCGSASSPSIRNEAPKSQEDTGVLLIGVTEQQVIDSLADTDHEVKYRRLNSKHKIIEVFGLSENQVGQLWPQAAIYKNQFFSTFEQEKLDPQAGIRLFAEEPAENDFVVTGDGEPLQECVEHWQPPTPKINVVSPTELNAGSITKGQTFVLNSMATTAHPRHPSALRKAWVVVPPAGSLQQQAIVFADKLEFKPDTMGSYQVLLVAQDKRNVCDADGINITVTSNAAYAKPLEDHQFQPLDESRFWHLADLGAKKSWQTSRGTGVVVAVIDSGVNYNHPRLNARMALNTNEIPGNDIDDDQNGFIDDVVGYDFANNDAFPFDDHGHGSHVAGLIAGEGFGMAQEASLLSIKAIGGVGGDVGSIAAAILYATDRGAHIINLSLGSYGAPHPLIVDAISYAEDNGALIVTASGNGNPQTGLGMNTDRTPLFPASLPNASVLSVAAKGPKDLLASYSNYGIESVDVVAPGGAGMGEMMSSCFLENPMGLEFMDMSGTSMATPVVAGIAAQVMAVNPQLTAIEVKQIIMTSGISHQRLRNIVLSGKVVHAAQAVEMSKQRVAQPSAANLLSH